MMFEELKPAKAYSSGYDTDDEMYCSDPDYRCGCEDRWECCRHCNHSGCHTCY